MPVQLEYGAIPRGTKVVPHTIHADLGVASIATQDEIMPIAVVDTSSRGAYFRCTRAQIQMYIDVSIEQLDGNQHGL